RPGRRPRERAVRRARPRADAVARVSVAGVCVGQSHMACVLAAAQEEGRPGRAIALKEGRLLEELGARAFELQRSRGRTPRDLSRDGGPVFSFIGGVSHLALAMKPHPEPFDFVLPEAPDLLIREDTTLVPFEAMRRLLADRLSPYLKVLERIARLADCAVYHF